MPDEINLADALLEDCDNLLIVTPELKIRAAKDQKEHTEVVVASERTFLIVVAVHKDKSRNTINRISCKRGVPIGGYVYDAQSEAYSYECSDYAMIGYLPVSFIMRVQGSSWQVRVPMCESVLKKFMTSLQKRELKNFKNHFKPEDYHIEFIQMIDPN
jgi:hypothetical protein